MEMIIFYCVALMFGAVGALFYYYPFQQGFDTKEKILYIAIGTFFLRCLFQCLQRMRCLEGHFYQH